MSRWRGCSKEQMLARILELEANEAEYERLFGKNTYRELADELALLMEALRKWAAYDALLRTLSGDVLFSGQMPNVDSVYDECVTATNSALFRASMPVIAQ